MVLFNFPADLTRINVRRRCASILGGMTTILRWSARITGAVMIMIGLVPVTPLIFLLVLVHTPPLGLRLQFWQTQAIGLGVAALGAGLVALSVRRSRPR